MRREHSNVVADRDSPWLNLKARDEMPAAFGEDVVQHHRVNASEHQVAERVHIILVGDRLQPVVALGTQQDLVRDRAAERADLTASEVLERAKPRSVGVSHAQDFAELVVRNRRCERRAPRRGVFDAAQPDLRVVAGDRLVDRSKRNRHEPRRSPETPGKQVGNFNVEADDLVRM